jgi:arsenate reductase
MRNNNETATNTRPQEKKKILFLCTHNSARSQMAEGLLRAVYRNRYEAYSAGIETISVNPHAVIVMKEIGIDIFQSALQNSPRIQGYYI